MKERKKLRPLFMARGWWPVVAVLVVVAGARAAGPAAKPAAPPPNQAAIKVVETEAAAKAAIEKARTSGTGLVADLALGHEGQLVRAESAESLPQGRYRLHALVARSPHDHILAEAVALRLTAGPATNVFDSPSWFPATGELAPVRLDLVVDKPGKLTIAADWIVGDTKLDREKYRDVAEARRAYLAQRQSAINQVGLKGGPDMSLQQSAPDDDGLDELLAEDMPRLAPRPLAGAGLPSHRLMLTGLVLERLSPVAVVAVKADAAAYEPGAKGKVTVDLHNLAAEPATAKLLWTVENDSRPGETVARHEETVTLAAGERRGHMLADPLATSGIARLGRVRVEAVVEGLRADACRAPFVVLPPKRTAAPAEPPKKVFAHYMGCYPAGTGVTSLHLFEASAAMLHESKDPVAAIGGRFRNFPLVWQERGLIKGKNGGWPLTAEESADLEIRRAMRIGINGFAVDAWAGGNDAIKSFETLIKVAAEKNYPFEMTLCLDGVDPVSTVKWLLKNHGKNPKLARRDGKPMVFEYNSSFMANAVLEASIDERIPQSDRLAAVRRLRTTELGWHLMGQTYRQYEELIGEPIFFSFDLCWLFFQVPDVKPDIPVRAAAAIARHVPLLWSFSTFGFPGNADEISKAVREAGAEWGGAASYHQKENYCHGAGFEVFMPQGTEWLFWTWNALRRQEATCLQLVTWNDYTENTNIGPAYNTRYGIYELTGHQIQKWRTGKEPVPDHDQVYVVYPKYPKDANTWPFRGQGGNRAIEIKTILTAPATIRLPGRSIEYEAKAGMDWISDDWEKKDWNEESRAIRAKDNFCRAQGFRQFPVTPGPVIVEVVREGKVVLRVESPEPITDRPFRQDCGAVCWSSEEERHWKADFGDKPMLRYSEYGDADNDGLPNWFEMYWFTKDRGFKPEVSEDPDELLDGPKPHPVTRWLDLSTQTLVDPQADPDADGRSNLKEYRAGTDPTVPERSAAPQPKF